MIIRSLRKDLMSHHFASERSRSRASFAHGYSSNILTVPQIQAYACKHATPSFAVRLRLYASLSNGDGEIRTLDPLLARQVLSQLSYTPIRVNLIFNLPVGLNK